MNRSLFFRTGTTAAAMLFAFLLGCIVGFYWHQPLESSTPAHEFEQYSLFTWNTRSGDLCFAIMLEVERPKFIHSWFPKTGAKCGISGLKKALVALPKDTYVFWETWPPKKMDYPPENVVQEVIEFAESR